MKIFRNLFFQTKYKLNTYIFPLEEFCKFSSFFAWIYKISHLSNLQYSAILKSKKGGISIKLQQALEQVCADSIEKFLSSDEMKLYLNEFLLDNADFILKSNINIKVDLNL